MPSIPSPQKLVAEASSQYVTVLHDVTLSKDSGSSTNASSSKIKPIVETYAELAQHNEAKMLREALTFGGIKDIGTLFVKARRKLASDGVDALMKVLVDCKQELPNEVENRLLRPFLIQEDPHVDCLKMATEDEHKGIAWDRFVRFPPAGRTIQPGKTKREGLDPNQERERSLRWLRLRWPQVRQADPNIEVAGWPPRGEWTPAHHDALATALENGDICPALPDHLQTQPLEEPEAGDEMVINRSAALWLQLCNRMHTEAAANRVEVPDMRLRPVAGGRMIPEFTQADNIGFPMPIGLNIHNMENLSFNDELPPVNVERQRRALEEAGIPTIPMTMNQNSPYVEIKQDQTGETIRTVVPKPDAVMRLDSAIGRKLRTLASVPITADADVVHRNLRLLADAQYFRKLCVLLFPCFFQLAPNQATEVLTLAAPSHEVSSSFWQKACSPGGHQRFVPYSKLKNADMPEIKNTLTRCKDSDARIRRGHSCADPLAEFVTTRDGARSDEPADAAARAVMQADQRPQRLQALGHNFLEDPEGEGLQRRRHRENAERKRVEMLERENGAEHLRRFLRDVVLVNICDSERFWIDDVMPENLRRHKPISSAGGLKPPGFSKSFLGEFMLSPEGSDDETMDEGGEVEKEFEARKLDVDFDVSADGVLVTVEVKYDLRRSVEVG